MVFKKRQIPWNKGLKGVQVGWKKGKKFGPLSAEIRLKMSLSAKGKSKSASHIKNNADAHRGLIYSNRAEKHFAWKGDDVGYRSLHNWIVRRLGKPHNCKQCGNQTLRHRQYHWANISGKYKRDLKDWMRLCVKCHLLFDRNQKND